MTNAENTREMKVNSVLTGLEGAGVDLGALADTRALHDAVKSVPVLPPGPTDALLQEVLNGTVGHDEMAERIRSAAADTPNQQTYNHLRHDIVEAVSARMLAALHENAADFLEQLRVPFDKAVADLDTAIAALGGITDPTRALAAGSEASEAYRQVTRASALLEAVASGVARLPDLGYGQVPNGEAVSWYVEITEDITEVNQLPQQKPDPAPLGRWHAWRTAGHTLTLATNTDRARRNDATAQLKRGQKPAPGPKMTAAARSNHWGEANAVIR